MRQSQDKRQSVFEIPGDKNNNYRNENGSGSKTNENNFLSLFRDIKSNVNLQPSKMSLQSLGDLSDLESQFDIRIQSNSRKLDNYKLYRNTLKNYQQHQQQQQQYKLQQNTQCLMESQLIPQQIANQIFKQVFQQITFNIIDKQIPKSSVNYSLFFMDRYLQHILFIQENTPQQPDFQQFIDNEDQEAQKPPIDNLQNNQIRMEKKYIQPPDFVSPSMSVNSTRSIRKSGSKTKFFSKILMQSSGQSFKRSDSISTSMYKSGLSTKSRTGRSDKSFKKKTYEYDLINIEPEKMLNEEEEQLERKVESLRLMKEQMEKQEKIRQEMYSQNENMIRQKQITMAQQVRNKAFTYDYNGQILVKKSDKNNMKHNHHVVKAELRGIEDRSCKLQKSFSMGRNKDNIQQQQDKQFEYIQQENSKAILVKKLPKHHRSKQHTYIQVKDIEENEEENIQELVQRNQERLKNLQHGSLDSRNMSLQNFRPAKGVTLQSPQQKIFKKGQDNVYDNINSQEEYMNSILGLQENEKLHITKKQYEQIVQQGNWVKRGSFHSNNNNLQDINNNNQKSYQDMALEYMQSHQQHHSPGQNKDFFINCAKKKRNLSDHLQEQKLNEDNVKLFQKSFLLMDFQSPNSLNSTQRSPNNKNNSCQTDRILSTSNYSKSGSNKAFKYGDVLQRTFQKKQVANTFVSAGQNFRDARNNESVLDQFNLSIMSKDKSWGINNREVIGHNYDKYRENIRNKKLASLYEQSTKDNSNNNSRIGQENNSLIQDNISNININNNNNSKLISPRANYLTKKSKTVSKKPNMQLQELQQLFRKRHIYPKNFKEQKYLKQQFDKQIEEHEQIQEKIQNYNMGQKNQI